jgi:arylsulfatase
MTLRPQKIFNLRQDFYQCADTTSNTFWDWNLNHFEDSYGLMDAVFLLIKTFDDFPLRSFRSSFNPANLMMGKLHEIKAGRKLKAAFSMLQ